MGYCLDNMEGNKGEIIYHPTLTLPLKGTNPWTGEGRTMQEQLSRGLSPLPQGEGGLRLHGRRR